MEPRERLLADCYRLAEETGDLELCLQRFPEMADELREHFALLQALGAAAPPEPASGPLSSGRRLLLSQIAAGPAPTPVFSRGLFARLAGGLAAVVFAGAFALGAAGASGASVPAPVTDVLGIVGIHNTSAGATTTATPAANHGQSVSDAVHTAIASSTPGHDRGEAVSHAACLAAHDRSTLPTPAQKAPGQEGKTAKDCDDAAETPAAGGDKDDDKNAADDDKKDNHGQHVSDAVHDAIALSSPGSGRGQAVSDAACKAAHDASTLPSGAQGAPGHQGSDDKCADKGGTAATPQPHGNGGGQNDQGGKPSDKGDPHK
jgi:hypothetical protein